MVDNNFFTILALYDKKSQSKVLDIKINIDDADAIHSYIEKNFHENKISELTKCFILKSKDNIPYIYKEYNFIHSLTKCCLHVAT